MRRFLAILLLTLSAASAQASMLFYAIAVPAEQAEHFVADQRQMVAALGRKGDTVLDLDKAWHGLHYLLTGTPYDNHGLLGQAILGGKEVGEDLGYGPARILSPERVKEIAGALGSLSTESLSSKYDPSAMERAKVYPNIWVREGPEGLRFLLNYLPALQAFYKKAAESGSAVILVIA